MTDATTNIIDPLQTLGIKEVAQRTGIPRTTIMKWLAEDEQAGRPGRQFPRPLGGHKLRWNVAGVVKWFERFHAGEEAA